MRCACPNEATQQFFLQARHGKRLVARRGARLEHGDGCVARHTRLQQTAKSHCVIELDNCEKSFVLSVGKHKNAHTRKHDQQAMTNTTDCATIPVHRLHSKRTRDHRWTIRSCERTRRLLDPQAVGRDCCQKKKRKFSTFIQTRSPSKTKTNKQTNKSNVNTCLLFATMRRNILFPKVHNLRLYHNAL